MSDANFAGTPVFPVEAITVSTWCPTPDASGPPTQVHVLLKASEELTLVLRFKSKHGLQNFIGALLDHGQEVWP